MTFNFFGIFCDRAPGLREEFRRHWPDCDVVEMSDPFRAFALRFPDGDYWPHSDDMPEPVRQAVCAISAKWRSARFLILRTNCWGGECDNWGLIIRDGAVVSDIQGQRALRDLIAHFGVDIGERQIFPPLYRAYLWRRLS